MPSPAWYQCTGPINVFGRVGYTGSGFYLGTCEQHPIPEGDIEYNEVMNDLGGNKVPADRQFMGAEEIIVLDLNRFNFAGYNVLRSGPSFNGNVGQTSSLARGSFVIQNQNAFELWLVYTFFGTPNVLDPNMPIGTYYPYCRLLGDHIPESGSKNMMGRLIVGAMNGFNTPAGNYFGWLLKSHNASYFTPLNGIVPQ